jgi:hypothetical protein
VYVGGSLLNKIPHTKPSSSKKKGPEVHKVQIESDSDSEDTLASLELHKVSKTHSNIIWATPEVEGVLTLANGIRHWLCCICTST